MRRVAAVDSQVGAASADLPFSSQLGSVVAIRAGSFSCAIPWPVLLSAESKKVLALILSSICLSVSQWRRLSLSGHDRHDQETPSGHFFALCEIAIKPRKVREKHKEK